MRASRDLCSLCDRYHGPEGCDGLAPAPTGLRERCPKCGSATLVTTYPPPSGLPVQVCAVCSWGNSRLPKVKKPFRKRRARR